jgi:antitoxin YefM
MEINMNSVPISDLRSHISELADRVCHHNERICIQRNGKPIFAMVSVEELKMLEKLEDLTDIKQGLEAIDRNDIVNWETARELLGL